MLKYEYAIFFYVYFSISDFYNIEYLLLLLSHSLKFQYKNIMTIILLYIDI